jgi:DnaK suppressor protein
MLAADIDIHLEDQLLTEAARLEQELAHLRQAVQGEVDIEPDEGDSEIVERERAAAVMDILERQLQTVKKALGAVEKGLYGVCERCGNAISVERLQVKPDATFCLACQRAAERARRRGR